MNKKTEANKAATSNAQEAQQRMHELYMAHQAHTLAQMIFRQFAGSWPMGHQPWLAPTGEIFAHQPFAPQQGWTPGMGAPLGFAPAAVGPLVYWYP